MSKECIDVRFSAHHCSGRDNHYLVSIHLRILPDEICSKSVKAIKEEVIKVFRESYNLTFGQLLQHDYSQTDSKQRPKQPSFSDFHKLLFARNRIDYTYKQLHSDDVYTLDHEEYDIIFVIIERLRQVNSCSTHSNIFTSGIDEADKLCLVYIIEDDGYFLKIPSERVFWLLDEDLSIGKAVWDVVDKSLISKFDTQIDAKIPNITLTLQYAHDLPPQPISIEITKTIDSKDKNNRPYLVYNIRAYIEPLTWVVQRRYSEFKNLHVALLAQSSTDIGYIPRSSLPTFPYSKQIVNKSSQQLAQKRKDALQEYLTLLMKVAPDEVSSNVHILTFLGAIRTSVPIQIKNTKQSRNVINIDHIESSLDNLKVSASIAGTSSALLNWGDLILFRSIAFAGTLQRLATGSEFDHVGIVVPSQSSSLLLLESTSEGVTMFPLVPRLQSYDYFKVSQYVVVRKLQGARTKEQYDTLLNFLNEVEGLPYSFNISSLFAGLRHKTTASAATTESEIGDHNQSKSSPPITSTSCKRKSFFCSELVAATLMAINVLPNIEQADTYWPGSFSIDKELDLRLKAINSVYSYGEEFSIDFHVMDIGRAQNTSAKGDRYGTRPQPVIHLNENVKSTFSSSDDDDYETDEEEDGDSDVLDMLAKDSIVVHERQPSKSEQMKTVLYKPKATFQPSIL